MKKLTKENIKELNKGMKLLEQKRCTKCGKKMKQIRDQMTGTITGYLWACDCSPDRVISIG